MQYFGFYVRFPKFRCSRYLRMWDTLLYYVAPLRVDAHRDCGGTHFRDRLIIVAAASGP